MLARDNLRYFKYLAWSIAFLSLLSPINTKAIVIRHDKSDREYQELATKYTNSIVYLGSCVGTIIAPEWIITAKHCFGNLSSESVSVRYLGRDYLTRKIMLHPKADIALVQLIHPLKDNNPVHLYPKQDERGMTVTFVGDGVFGNGKVGLIKNDRIKRAATNAIEDVNESWIYFNFDRPPQALALEGISGPGDSGGPALIERDSKIFIVGVSSGQKNDGKEGIYGVQEYYARISTNLPWIYQTMEQPADNLDVEILCQKFPLNSRCEN
jgi:hypothetical protein